MNNLRACILIIGILVFPKIIKAQFTGVSGGLAFSSGIDYNSGKTGNPGLFGKAYLKINNRLHLIPAVTAFNKFKKSDFNKTLRNYMFHADVDVSYGIFKDQNIRIIGFGGFNATALMSKWEVTNDEGLDLVNRSDLMPGLNLGGALLLYVNDDFDAYASAKYIVSSFDQFIIDLGAIYYFGGKRRKGAW